jgi:ElaB/YqjD/DUF883 family membrane-anchored ribosome-binding protein
MKNEDNNKLDQILELVIKANKNRDHERIDNLKKYMARILATVGKQKSIKKIKDTAERVNDHVHEKPWLYIGGAALGGLLIGFFTHKRK